MTLRLRPLLLLLSWAALPLAQAADPSELLPASQAVANSNPRSLTYTVKKGDTLGSVAHQFHCTTATLKKLNKLKRSHLVLGQVLQLPSSHSSLAATRKLSGKGAGSHLTSGKLAKGAIHRRGLVAQPVQDFDVPPSTFASCPVPVPSEVEGVAPVTDAGSVITAETPSGPVSSAPPQSLVFQKQPAPTFAAPPVPLAPAEETSLPYPSSFASHPTSALPPSARASSAPVLSTAVPEKKGLASAISDFFGGSHSSESGEWGNRFLVQAQDLAGRGIGYDQSWRPDGESRSWAMDCSNTTRYLYRVTANIQLPRTASDQYYYLHLQGKAWDVPMTSRGFADCNFLRTNLKPGDLLFWENTYRPERQPPITHVMIFLGSDSKARWLMAGSQNGRHGFYNPHKTGPDVYVFDPTHYAGGYTTWMGLVHHHGRFVAYGRPLEADAKKLSVAEND